AASAAGLKPEQVRVHTTFLGGGFGRRLDVDFVPAAVEASKAVGKPVKLLWTREDDTTHDVYRPPAFDTAIGAFDKSGKLIASKQPRYLKALELAAQEARYGAAPKGRFHGVAVMSGYDTYMAQVAEISLENGKVRVHRIVCAVDCGQVVNRDIVVAQVESGIIF